MRTGAGPDWALVFVGETCLPRVDLKREFREDRSRGAGESKHGRVQEGQVRRARSCRRGGLDQGLDSNLRALGSQ